MTMTASGALIIQRIDRTVIVGVATPAQHIAGLVAMGYSAPMAWAIEDGALRSPRWGWAGRGGCWRRTRREAGGWFIKQ